MTTRQPARRPALRTKKAALEAQAAPRTAYLVLGMHRSGTSAVTQLLALAGAQLPENVMPGDQHNAKGYFEPWKIALFNDERLRAGGSAWDDVFAFPFQPLPPQAERRWGRRARSLLAEEYGDRPFPLLKDPRVTVLLPFWRPVFDALKMSPRCVVPVRHPLAVSGSLARRNGFAPEKSVLLWSAYMLAAEAYTRDLPRAFVDYEALLTDWRGQAARIEVAHGAPLPKLDADAAEAIDGFLTTELRHNDATGDLAALGWAGDLAAEVYGWFLAAATGQAPDRAPLIHAAEALDARRREMGALITPVTRELDVTRSELLETRRRLLAERKAMNAAQRRDRKVMEAGWRRDAKVWQAEQRALEAHCQRLNAERAALEAELIGLQQACDLAAAQLAAILAEAD
jgi:hypothetical protein